MKLSQLSGQSKSNDNADAALRALALGAMIEEAPVLNVLQFYSMVGSADSVLNNSGASGGTFRTINDEYPDNRVSPTTSAVSLVAFGGVVQTDIAYDRRGYQIAGQRRTDLEKFARNVGKNFQYQLFNADGTSGGFTGLLSLATTASRNTAYGDDLTTDAKVKALMRLLTKLTVETKANLIVMPIGLIGHITLFQSSGIAYAPTGPLGSYQYSYNSVPIVPAGTASNGDQTLPWASGVTGKIAVLRTSEKMDVTCATNIGVQVLNQGVVGTAHNTLLEFDVCPVLQAPEAISVITSITYTA